MIDFSAILDAYLDDELTDQQHRELAAWMAEDPGNIDRLVSQCCLDSYLQDIFRGEQVARNAVANFEIVGENQPVRNEIEQTAGGERGTPVRSAPVSIAPIPLIADSPPLFSNDFPFANSVVGPFGYLSQGWPLAYLVATVVVGIGLTIAAVIPVSHAVQVAQQSSLPAAAQGSRASEPEIKSVGRITGMVDCRWAEGSRFKVQGSRSKPGNSPLSPLPSPLIRLGDTFALASGLLEISYNSGAKVILDGPATYEVDSTSGGYLSLGKLTAKVERQAAGGQWSVTGGNHQSSIINQQSSNPLFAVRTPTAVVTDLGTEFGVETDGNVTRSYVYQGQVEVTPCTGRDAAAKIRLTERESVTIDRTGVVSTKQPVDGRRFTRRLTVRPFGGSPDLAEGTEVFCQRFDADSVNLAADYTGLVYGPCLPSTGKAAGDMAVVSGGVLLLSHEARGDHTECVMTVQEFSGRMIVSVDIGADGMSIGMSHVGLCLGDRTFVIHPGFSRDGLQGAFRTKKGGIGRTKDNIDMGFVPQCNLMHHLFVYYDGMNTFHVCLIDAANSRNVFRTTVVDRKCPQTFSIGVCRSGSMRTAMFDNLRVIQLPVDKKINPIKRQ